MTQVRLPDGSTRELSAGATAADLAAAIGPGLAKAADHRYPVVARQWASFSTVGGSIQPM